MIPVHQYPRGVWYGRHHGPQRIGCRRCGADNRSLAVLSTRLAFYNCPRCGDLHCRCRVFSFGLHPFSRAISKGNGREACDDPAVRFSSRGGMQWRAVPLNTGSAPADTRAPLNRPAGYGPRDSVSFKSLATKDGAEPSIARSSDAGAVPAGSTNTRYTCGTYTFAGPNQDRRRSDDRSCTRRDLPQSVETKCERQSVRRSGTAPRGVSVEPGSRAPGNRSPHSISSFRVTGNPNKPSPRVRYFGTCPSSNIDERLAFKGVTDAGMIERRAG